MTKTTKANGSPATIAAACRADSPPAASKIAAITPSVVAQNKRWIFGGLVSPPAVNISMTKLAESDEVTNHSIIMTTISSVIGFANG